MLARRIDQAARLTGQFTLISLVATGIWCLPAADFSMVTALVTISSRGSSTTA